MILEGLTSPAAHAHVRYVLDEMQLAQTAGSHPEFFSGIFSDPLNLLLIGGSLIFVTGILLLLKKSRFLKREQKSVIAKKQAYQSLFPWMIRLSLGIALIGAGSSQVLLNPAFGTTSVLASFEILVEFSLLTGFLLTLSTWLVILLFFTALATHPYAIGNIDYLALGVGLLLLGDNRPGVDDLLGIPYFGTCPKWKGWFPLVLRIGIGGSMIYLAIVEKFLAPLSSALVVQTYQLNALIPVSDQMWVFSAGVIELLIGCMILFGIKTRLASAIAFVVLTGSFFFFGEDVYAHVTLFAGLSMLFVAGSGTKRAAMRNA